MYGQHTGLQAYPVVQNEGLFAADLGPGETSITWPILNGFPDLKDS